MNTWRLKPVAALLLIGASHAAMAASATVYYYTPYKSWSTVFIHHNGSGSWTTAPGTQMTAACTNWTRATVDFGTAANFQAVFTNGSGAWDNLNNQSGSNYTLAAGTHQIRNGQLIANAGDPCDTSPKHTTVYYRSAWAPAFVHYSIGGGAWTTAPGTAMEAACAGWQKKTIDLGAATTLTAAFNNGNGQWDSNGGRNYTLGINDQAVDAGQVSATNPCPVDTQAPTVPTGLATGTITPTSIVLNWTASTDNVGVTGYEIRRGTTLIATTSGTGVTYTATGLTADTAYTFTVAARDLAGNVSAQSAVLSTRTAPPDRQAPTVPTGLTQGTVTSTSVALTWNASTDNVKVKGYGVLRDGRLIGTTTKTSYTDKTAQASTTYRYTVAAGDTSDNHSAQSSPVSVTTPAPDRTPPSSTGPLTGRLDGSAAVLSWGAATDDRGIGGYVITRTGGTTAATFTTTGTATTYTDRTGAAGTTYSYTVKAKDTSGNLSTSPSNSVSLTIPAASTAFSWDNATVYFVLNDRFVNADTRNDRSYCRESDANCQPFSNNLTQLPSAFHGGDLKGITEKINSNYFKQLGINTLWITAPYEQMHGFVYGNDHKHYGYHGYYTLDWTSIDKNMGTREDLQALVDAAHAQGIRVVMDVVLNHVGYENIKDMHEYGYGSLKNGWEATAYKTGDDLNWNNDIGAFIDYTNPVWGSTFWGSSWIRMNNVAGVDQCDGTDGLRGCVGFLPDVKTEAGAVGLPPILVTKWTREGRLASEQQKLDAWFSATGKTRSPANYIIKWLTDYVRDFGIDGFRVDTAKHVELSVWRDLKTEATAARNAWLAANPTKAATLTGDRSFWMTGEVWGHGVGRDSYFDNGFDSIINFSFQGAAGNVAGLDATYVNLAGVNADNSTPYNMLSYISSHDKGLFDRGNLKTGLTSLLLAPGGVQLFYGDETARPLMNNWGGDHAWRGDMNWSSINNDVLTHAQKLGTFRNRHIAVGAGSHAKLADSPYTFSRVKDGDKVVVAVGASGTVAINVGNVFADGTAVRDAYTGTTATVSGGRVTVTAHANGVVLLEAAQ